MQPKKNNPLVDLVIVLVMALLLFAGGGDAPSIIAPAVVDRVTYVHDEKAPIPPPVIAAIAELNTKNILATMFPDDTTDGDGEVPDQYRVALPAAKASGIPSLVVQAGDKVVRVVKSPTTKSQVLEASR